MRRDRVVFPCYNVAPDDKPDSSTKRVAALVSSTGAVTLQALFTGSDSYVVSTTSSDNTRLWTSSFNADPDSSYEGALTYSEVNAAAAGLSSQELVSGLTSPYRALVYSNGTLYGEKERRELKMGPAYAVPSDGVVVVALISVK